MKWYYNALFIGMVFGAIPAVILDMILNLQTALFMMMTYLLVLSLIIIACNIKGDVK